MSCSVHDHENSQKASCTQNQKTCDLIHESRLTLINFGTDAEPLDFVCMHNSNYPPIFLRYGESLVQK